MRQKIILLVLTCVVLASCSGGVGGTTANEPGSVRSVVAYLIQAGPNGRLIYADDPPPPTGAQVAPFDVYTWFDWTIGPPAQDGGHNEVQALGKAEVDFGDGAGWEDVTQTMHDLQQAILDGSYPNGTPLSADVHHVYSLPGFYHVYWRFTYWDGEVITLPYTIGVEVNSPN